MNLRGKALLHSEGIMQSYAKKGSSLSGSIFSRGYLHKKPWPSEAEGSIRLRGSTVRTGLDGVIHADL